MLGSEASYYLY